MKNKISDTKNIEWRIYPLEKSMLLILFLDTMRTDIIVGKNLNKIFGMIGNGKNLKNFRKRIERLE